MRNHRYLALLRGINVGGNNLIRMQDLKIAFEKMGFTDVITYIQSGNVIFSSTSSSKDMLTKRIEQSLSKRFNYVAKVVVISSNELKKVVSKAPKGFGGNSTKYRYDVIFLKKPATAVQALKEVKPREGVDTVVKGAGVLYFSRSIEGISKSHISKIILLPIYKYMTIRNWNTTSKLVALIEHD